MKLFAEKILDIIEVKTKTWHNRVRKPSISKKDGYSLVRSLHYYNFMLWHEEDEARRTDVSDSVIAGSKRVIDKLNQLRNNTIEEFDDWFLSNKKYAKELNANSKLNSETLGSIADKLSIITLKVYHMGIEAKRKSAGREHVALCKEKLRVLKVQQKDLVMCFNDLLRDIREGKRYIKVYRQFKMYNDSKLNPKLYEK